MLERPAHIPAALTRAPLDFPWSNKISMRLDDFDAVPPDLGSALAMIGYKARMALGLACLEWVIWRLSGWADVRDALHRVEAAWATQVSVTCSRPLGLDSVRNDLGVPGDPAGPLQEALMRLEMLDLLYRKGKPQLSTKSGHCALLARHVLPADSGFEAWLERALTALAVTDPCSPDFVRRAPSFDYSGEAAIPRAWFATPTLPRDQTSTTAQWNAFFTAANPADNPYLVPGETRISSH
ncbi:hypothetical protein [Nocardia sp. NPDC005825]|uniref:hypothetical protein n=1 Tax=unclassified Nocardia TaxID=2637762 RepID=UPI0033D4DF7D